MIDVTCFWYAKRFANLQKIFSFHLREYYREFEMDIHNVSLRYYDDILSVIC